MKGRSLSNSGPSLTTRPSRKFYDLCAGFQCWPRGADYGVSVYTTPPPGIRLVPPPAVVPYRLLSLSISGGVQG